MGKCAHITPCTQKPIRYDVNMASGETKTSKCLDPRPTESYQRLSVSLPVCPSVRLSVQHFSQEWLISSLEYLKTDRAPFSRKIHVDNYFFILILYIYSYSLKYFVISFSRR